MMNPNQPSFWRMPESSQNSCLLDAGRYGLLGICSRRYSTFYIHVVVSSRDISCIL